MPKIDGRMHITRSWGDPWLALETATGTIGVSPVARRGIPGVPMDIAKEMAKRWNKAGNGVRKDIRENWATSPPKRAPAIVDEWDDMPGYAMRGLRRIWRGYYYDWRSPNRGDPGGWIRGERVKKK